MATEIKNPDIPIENGLVAFFDILGYRNLLLTNSAQEALEIINASVLLSVKEAKKEYKTIIKPDMFVISDSILFFMPLKQESDSTGITPLFFIFLCAGFMTKLLQKGLPVRAAISAGEFCFQSKKNQVVFAGQPIVEAYELASSLEIAACALVPSAENKFLNNSAHQLLQLYKTPIKNLPLCELHLLKYIFRDCSRTREEIIAKFTQHGKTLNSDSLFKFNNTIQFLKSCNQVKPENKCCS